MDEERKDENLTQIAQRFAVLRGRGWRITLGGRLRCQKGYCPIVALDDAEGGHGIQPLVGSLDHDDRSTDGDSVTISVTNRLNSSYRQIGRGLGLEPALIEGIVAVADGSNLYTAAEMFAPQDRVPLRHVQLRSQLEAALGQLMDEAVENNI